MTDPRCFWALWDRAARALTSVRGAFDLTSVITGAVVVAILTGGVLATTFGAIPFAQDHGARQDLFSVRTAEGVAKLKDGKFLTTDGLRDAGYLNAGSSMAVGADTAGSCWVGITRSDSGAAFYATSAKAEPMSYSEELDTGCMTSDQQLDLAIAAGAAKPANAAAWGLGSLGQLGNGSTTTSTVPTTLTSSGILAGKTLTGLTAGDAHTCGISGGAAYCWGYNAAGQLGDGTTTNSTVPVAVTASGALAGKTVTAIAAGERFTCAIADGAAYCWGRNNYGQLGIGSTVNSSVPVAVDVSGVLAGKTITAIDAGQYHACAVASGEAYCWGSGGFGQLGNGETGTKTVPVAVHKQWNVMLGKTVFKIVTGRAHSCAVTTANIYCWGYNQNRELGHDWNSQTTIPDRTAIALEGKAITDISSGPMGTHTCVVADGQAYCWGVNTSGQIGNNTTGAWLLPTAVDTSGVLAGKTVTGISAGLNSTCAVADRAAYCWGNNANGQLGNGSGANSSVPVAAGGDVAGKRVMFLTLGDRHAAAVYR